MWLADKMYILYNLVCLTVAFLFGFSPLNWGLLISLAVLWIIVTIIYVEYRYGG